MHVYFYDNFVSEKKYSRPLAKIEARLTDLGIAGKAYRLGVVKNLNEAIDSEIRRGAKTVVVVGDDSTFNSALRSVANKEVVFGYIPLGPNRMVANLLGIKDEVQACEVLSARIIEKLDLGAFNNSLFLTEALIEAEGTVVEIDKNFSIEAPAEGLIRIINLPLSREDLPRDGAFDPRDGLVELFIKTEKKRGVIIRSSTVGKSYFKIKSSLTLANDKKEILLDSSRPISSPAELSVLPGAINIIVGKQRQF